MRNLAERLSKRLLAGFLFSVLAASAMWAQSTAQINGTVSDQTGAVLPGVELTATQTATGLTRNVITDETGSYTLTNLPIGPYRLEAALPGFRSYAQTGIVLQVGANPVINVVMEVGQVADSVEVQADAALVETRTTGIGQMIDNVRVLEMPLNARNVTELILLSGAAVEGPRGNERGYPTLGISVGGGMTNGLTFLLDGGTHNDPFSNFNLPMPFPDALQEFKVETSAVPAQYGQHSAGAVNAVTKSGTNAFHGSAFEFVRNKVFNARNAFAVEKDGLKRNQFGGVLGGPIVRNKLFFFGGYQRTTDRSEPTQLRSYIPTAAMLAGDWTTVTSTACRTSPLTLRAPFVNNRINPSLFHPVALNVLKQIPTTDDPCGEVRYGRNADQNEDIYVGKVDYQKSDRHSLFVRYSLHELFTASGYDGKNILSIGSQPNYDRRAQSSVLGDTFLIGANVVNSFRATFFRVKNEKDVPKDFFTWSDMGVKNLWYPEGWKKMASLTVTNGFSLVGAPAFPGPTNYTGFQFANDMSWVKGPHQLAWGGSFLHTKMGVLAGTAGTGGFTFRTSFTNLGLGDFMLGQVDSWQQGNVASWHPRQNYMGAFVQDTWKANSRLTVNAGVRWEPFLPFWRKRERLARFEREWFDQGIKSTIFKNSPAGVLFSGGDPGMRDDNKLSDNSWMQFAPRVGLAWDTAGNGMMTVRGAYGIFFDYPHLYQFNGFRSQPPFENRVTRTRVPDSFGDPWVGFPGGNPFPFFLDANAPFAPGSIYFTTPKKLKAPYVHQWNLSVQRQIGPDWMVAANYVGNSVIHLLDIREGNPGVYIPGSTLSLAQRRVLSLANPVEGPKIGNLNVTDDGGTRSYNALWLQVQRRRARGLTVQGNYTWSHCIDDGTSTSGHSPNQDEITRRGLDRSNCSEDRRHNFNTSTVYETPQFANTAARILLSSWRISGIVKIASGGFLTIDCDCDNAQTGVDNQRADQVLADPYAANKSVNQFLNPAAFTAPAIGRYGNMGQSNIAGAGSIKIDMGLTRTFRIRETHSLEFRAEAFNIPNRLNPGTPEQALTSANFGRILSAGDPRIMQLALKYVF